MADDGSLSLPIGADARLLEAQLNRAVNALNRSMDTMEARTARGAKNVNRNIESMFGHTEIGKALDKVFDSSKLAVLEEGSTRLRVFGSALEPLGVYGFAAAAGVAALGLAIEKGKEVAEWAEGLEKASRTLGLTTTQLQQFDFVAQATGIDVAKNREAMSGLERTIGAVGDGSAKARQLKIFTDGLKITPDQLRGWGTLQEQFPHIVDAMAKLNPEALADFASKMKIDPEVAQSWVDQREHVRDLIDEANRMGIVLDEAGVAKMAKAGEEMRHTGAIIQGELNVALSDMAPLLGAGAKGLAGMVEDAANVEKGLRKAVTAVSDFIGWVDSTVPALGALDTWAINAVGGLNGLWTTLNHVINPLSIVVDLLKQLGALPEKGPAAGAKPAAPPPLVPLIRPTGSGGHRGAGARAPESDAAARLKAAQDAVDEAQRRMAQASVDDPGGSLGGGTVAGVGIRGAYSDTQLEGAYKRRADAEVAAIDAELKHQQDDLRAENQKNQDDEKLSAAMKGRLKRQLEVAALDNQDAADAKKRKALHDAALAQEDASNEVYKAKVEAQIAELEAQEKIATTIKARRDLEDRILKLRQGLESDLRTTELQRQRAKGDISDGQYRQQLDSLGGSQAAARTAASFDNLGPLAQFSRQATGVDPSEQLQTNVVEAMKALNAGLAEAILNGKSLGDVLKNVFKKLASDLLNQGLQGLEGNLLKGLSGGGGIIDALTSTASALPGAAGASAGAGGVGGIASILTLLLHFLPGFADGTDSSPAGWKIVGEHGPEAINTGAGSKIVPNHILAAMASGGLRSGGATTVNAPAISIHFDLSGTVTDSSLDQKISRAKLEMLDLAQRAAPKWVNSAQRQRG